MSRAKYIHHNYKKAPEFKCGAIRNPGHYDTSKDDSQCLRGARYLIDGIYFCKPHASVRALEILLEPV